MTSNHVESHRSVEGDVVNPPIPDASVSHAIRRERHDSTDDTTSQNIIPMMELIDGQRACDEACSEDGGVDCCEFPERGVVVGEDLQFAIEVERQKNETCKGGGAVARRHGFEGVVDLLLVAGANLAGVINALISHPIQAIPHHPRGIRDLGQIRLANIQKMRPQPSDQPLDKNLKHGRRNQTVQQPDNPVINIPKTPHPDLTKKNNGNRNQRRQQSGSPDGDDLGTHRVGECGVDDFAGRREGDGEGAGRGGFCPVHAEADGAEDDHGDEVESGQAEPGAEAGAFGHGVGFAGAAGAAGRGGGGCPVGGAGLAAAAEEGHGVVKVDRGGYGSEEVKAWQGTGGAAAAVSEVGLAGETAAR